jgi:hypothetical protein
MNLSFSFFVFVLFKTWFCAKFICFLSPLSVLFVVLDIKQKKKEISNETSREIWFNNHSFILLFFFQHCRFDIDNMSSDMISPSSSSSQMDNSNSSSNDGNHVRMRGI